MATRTSKKDLYTNIITVSVTESAANTLTFEEVDIGLNLFDKVGLLVSRLEYHLDRGQGIKIIDESDRIQMCLAQSNSFSTIIATERSVIHAMQMYPKAFGTPGNGEIIYMPLQFDFSDLPGGGMLVVPKPLYVGLEGTSLATALTGILRIYFTIQPLKDADYLELVETRRFFG